MKRVLLFIFSVFLINASLHAQDSVTSVEAEAGILSGTSIAPQTGSSSGGYVTGFDNDGDKVTVTVTVPATSNYNLKIRYRSIYDVKTQDLYVNGVYAAGVVFPKIADFADLNAGTVFLNSGTNTLTIQKNWGYMDVDKFTLYTVPPNVFSITPVLIDVQANNVVKSLYNFLRSQFGKRIISGTTNDYYDSIKTVTGKSPLLRAWDMASYSPMYPWKWDNGFVFGPVDNHDAENAINWYNATGQKGIVSFHWHWGSPSGATPGKNTFYTVNTSFEISQAVISGTQQNIDAIRDIDAIAVQLKKLQDAGVPVLWRPLHEAGGGWFWWGAKGAAPAKALWDIMYDRLTNYHGLHNLIWVWSTPEASWYPGNSKVDMIGFDSYPGDYNYTTQKNMFDNLYNITSGQKLIAMSENGPIPDINNAFSADAPWSYFMSWNDLVFKQNSTQHIQDVYSNAKVITLENFAAAALPVILTDFKATPQGAKAKIEWITSSEQNNDHFTIERSSDGTHFFPLTTVKGFGNSSEAHHYILFDNNPSSGVNYYRLVQYNFDGKSADHGIKSVSFNLSKLPSVKAFPNPAVNGLGILLSNYQGKKINVSLINLSGKIIYKQTIQTDNGQGYYRLNAGRIIAGGQYILKVDGKDIQQSIKVLVN